MSETQTPAILLPVLERQAVATERIAEVLESMLSMMVSVQPKELAKKAKEHKTTRAKLRKEGNKNGE